MPPAGVGALGAEAHGLGLLHDYGQNRHRPVGGDRGGAERGEPVAHLPAVDIGDLPSRELRQDLLAQIAPVDAKRSRLPEPLVTLEHGLGDGLEEGLFGIAGRLPMRA